MREIGTYKRRVTIALCAVVTLFLSIACSNKPEVSNEVIDRAVAPRLRAQEISTIISDSGITRYRITAKTWMVFDKAEEPYWDFPDGLHLERFDEDYNTDAKIDCKRARYFDQKQLWQLDDSVRVLNLEGNQFLTQQLFWDQNAERVYSDSFITIVQTDKQIFGYGFDSNQEMSRYVIRDPRGIIPIDSEE